MSHSNQPDPVTMSTGDSVRKAIVALLSLGGMYFSGLLTKKHIEFANGVVQPDGFCKIGQTFNCETVATSQFSTLMGIPISSLNFMLFALTLFMILNSYTSPLKQLKSRLTFLSNFYGLASLICIALLGVSHFIIHAYCLYCISLYFINIGLFLVIWASYRQVQKSLALEKSMVVDAPLLNMPILGLSGLAALGILIWPTIYQKYQLSDVLSAQNDVVDAYQKSDFLMHIPVQNSPYFGNRDAKVQIVEYFDFQCPHCKTSSEQLLAVLQDLKAQVLLVFKNYPLDMACNPKITQMFHRSACQAAYASLCALRNNKYWEFESELFSQQDRISAPYIEETFVKIGLDKNLLAPCYEDKEIIAQVRNDLDIGEQLGIEGTPSIFINGKRFDMSWGLQNIPAIVRYLNLNPVPKN